MENNTAIVSQFQAKLLSINTDILTNKNGKNYIRVVVELEGKDGRKIEQGAIIYEGNYSKTELKTGEKYLVTRNEEGYLQMSHLQGNLRLSNEEFEALGVIGAVKRTTTRTRLTAQQTAALAAVEL